MPRYHFHVQLGDRFIQDLPHRTTIITDDLGRIAFIVAL